MVPLLIHLVDLLLELGHLLGRSVQDPPPPVLKHPPRDVLAGLLQLCGLARCPAVSPLAVLLHKLFHPLWRLFALGLQTPRLLDRPLRLAPLLIVGHHLVHPLGNRLVLLDELLSLLLGPLEGGVLLHALLPLLPGQLRLLLAPRGGALRQMAEGALLEGALEVDPQRLLADEGGTGLQEQGAVLLGGRAAGRKGGEVHGLSERHGRG
mmetsp:Transcript_28025/g.74985  ORF Transcript_28025/g.74985 Transcript_28025/m.74985 type:complete len:208 (-) Transcript_28025:65-688(-)